MTDYTVLRSSHEIKSEKKLQIFFFVFKRVSFKKKIMLEHKIKYIYILVIVYIT